MTFLYITFTDGSIGNALVPDEMVDVIRRAHNVESAYTIETGAKVDKLIADAAFVMTKEANA